MAKGCVEPWAIPEMRLHLVGSHAALAATREWFNDLEKPKRCAWCLHDESISHIFFNCRFVKQVWNPICAWTGLGRAMTTIHSAIKWTFKLARGKTWQHARARLALACTVFCIWKERNKRIHENSSTSAASIITKILYNVLLKSSHLFPDLNFDDV